MNEQMTRLDQVDPLDLRRMRLSLLEALIDHWDDLTIHQIQQLTDLIGTCTEAISNAQRNAE
jgi:hypothetical protein